MGGGFGHFYAYAPFKIEYAIDRYSMETKRLFDVANNRLKETRFLGGDEYSIADMSAYPWLGNIHRGEAYGDAATFLSMHEYEAVGRWVAEIDARPAVKRGRLVNTNKGILERHSAADFAALPEGVL
jgi:GST-like protein